jgi:hypothetical protein
MEETAVTIPDTAQSLRPECVTVEILIWSSVRTGAGVGNSEISDEIRFVHAGSAGERAVSALADCDRKSRSESGDPIQAPSVNESFRRRTKPSQEWYFVIVTDDEIVGKIERR